MLSLDEIRRIATLARLKIDSEKESYFQQELQIVLEYFQSLQKLDTLDVPATVHSVDLGLHIRGDNPQKCLPREQVFYNAPQTNSEFFIVPKVVEK